MRFELPPLRRTIVVHVSAPYQVLVTRPTKWGNPFVRGVHGTKVECVEKHREWLRARPQLIAHARVVLRGKRIACTCRSQPCHAYTLARVADGGEP